MERSGYVKLDLGATNSGRPAYVVAWRSTADFYGWTEAFSEYVPEGHYGEDGRYYFTDPGRKSSLQYCGGQRLRICRSPSRFGYPAGMTNAFRISRSCTYFHLAKLARFTAVDWYWMEGKSRGRIEKDRWLEMFHEGLQ